MTVAVHSATSSSLKIFDASMAKILITRKLQCDSRSFRSLSEGSGKYDCIVIVGRGDCPQALYRRSSFTLEL
jgi:hypothetical protein